MTEQEAYMQGFCKTAADAGADPQELLKLAEGAGWLDSIKDAYKSLSPSAKRAVLGGLALGAGTYTFSDGDFSNRLMKALAAGSLGGAGIYGLSRSGLIDKGVNWTKNKLNRL